MCTASASPSLRKASTKSRSSWCKAWNAETSGSYQSPPTSRSATIVKHSKPNVDQTSNYILQFNILNPWVTESPWNTFLLATARTQSVPTSLGWLHELTPRLQRAAYFFTLPQAASSDVRNRKRMKESLTLGTGVLEALQNRIVTFHESLLCWGIWRSIEIEGPPQKKQICLSWGSLNQSQARPWPFCIHAQLPSRWHCNISQLLQRGKLHGKSSLPCLAFDGW